MLEKLFRSRKGQGLVEYALIIAGVTLVAATGVIDLRPQGGWLDQHGGRGPTQRHHDDCNAPIVNGQLIETTQDASGNLVVGYRLPLPPIREH